MFSFDFSKDKPDIRENIPAGIPLFLEFRYTPGGADVPGTPQDRKEGALTQSKETDAMYLKGELTVLRGPYKGRKFWSNLTVSGGKVDEKGNSKAAGITRQTLRLMIDSSTGLSSKDESPDAAAKRNIAGFRDLQGRRFVALSKIGKAQAGYDAKNELGQVLTVDMTKYPKTDAELDNPVVATTTTPAAPPAPAPAWTGGTSVATPAVDTPPAFQAPAEASTQNIAAFPAPATTTATAAPAPVQDNGLPKWAA